VLGAMELGAKKPLLDDLVCTGIDEVDSLGSFSRWETRMAVGRAHLEFETRVAFRQSGLNQC
jgi:hypothetical protein